jgi:hypothetical protein
MSATRTAFLTPASCRFPGRRPYLQFSGLFLVAALFLAPSRASAAVSINVSPSTVNLPAAGTQQFTATVTGSSDVAVIWTVREGMPGGTVTGSGLYMAPGVVGVYHVVATSHADSSQSATATIAVPGFTSPSLFMNVGRVSHTATQLQDGRILFIGGLDGAGLATSSAEIYDPGTGKFTLTGSLSDGRFGHTATLLSNGKVLVAGGARDSSNPVLVPTVELYDPQSGTFSRTGNLGELRFLHTATLLADGKVLVSGGQDTVPGFSGQASIGSAELYDPVSGAFSFTANLNAPRFWHTATLLNNGRVLIAGGTVNVPYTYPPLLPTPGELYDPETGKFTNIGAFGDEASGDASAAVPLQSGQVLTWATAVYDPVANTFSTVPVLLQAPSANRQGYTGTLLPNGIVLITGGDGVSANQDVAAAFLLDPAHSSWTQIPDMPSPRVAHTANLLSNGLVLIAGGGTAFNQGGFASAELYQPPLAASAPSVTSISPNPITGFTPITFTVLGANFVVGAVIRVDSTMLPTTFISSTQLSATILYGTLQAPGAHTVTVTDLDGESSAPCVLTVDNPHFWTILTQQGNSVDFSHVAVGSSGSRALTFNNSGNVPLQVDSLAITGPNSSDFAFDRVLTTCPLHGGALQPGAICDAQIQFAPQAVSQTSPSVATLTVTYEEPGSPLLITLIGVGSTSAPPLITPSSYVFGNQIVGTSSTSQSLTVSNRTIRTLGISSVTLTNTSDYSMSDNCAASLVVGASCTVTVTFAPSGSGSRAGSVAILASDSSIPQTIPITGMGTNFVITAVTGNSGSATVAAGQPAIFQLSLSPQDFTGVVTVNCIETKAIPNTTCTVSPNPAMLNGTTVTPVTVMVTTMARSGLAAPIQTKRFLLARTLDVRAMRLLSCLLILLTLTMVLARGRKGTRLALATAFLFALSITGCGSVVSNGGGTPPPSGPGTPSGTYQLLVTAASSGVTRTTMLTLTVQ